MVLRRLGLQQGMEEKEVGLGNPQVPGSSLPAFALGFGRPQALLPHSLDSLKEGWELSLFEGCLSCPPPLLVIGLWVVPLL